MSGIATTTLVRRPVNTRVTKQMMDYAATDNSIARIATVRVITPAGKKLAAKLELVQRQVKADTVVLHSQTKGSYVAAMAANAEDDAKRRSSRLEAFGKMASKISA